MSVCISQHTRRHAQASPTVSTALKKHADLFATTYETDSLDNLHMLALSRAHDTEGTKKGQ